MFWLALWLFNSCFFGLRLDISDRLLTFWIMFWRFNKIWTFPSSKLFTIFFFPRVTAPFTGNFATVRRKSETYLVDFEMVFCFAFAHPPLFFQVLTSSIEWLTSHMFPHLTENLAPFGSDHPDDLRLWESRHRKSALERRHHQISRILWRRLFRLLDPGKLVHRPQYSIL